MRFMNWINEIHADFGGTQKMADSSRQRLLASIKYEKNIHQSLDDDFHPSWDRRELIDQIAKDAGCEDAKFIDKVKNCGYYNDIILKDED